MRDGEVLVFVEVRYRHSSAFGSPAETVDRRKQARLRAAASHYLVKHAIDQPCRFDVVAVSGGNLQAWRMGSCQKLPHGWRVNSLILHATIHGSRMQLLLESWGGWTAPFGPS